MIIGQRALPKASSLLVTHVDKTWNTIVEGLERIDAAFDDLILDEER